MHIRKFSSRLIGQAEKQRYHKGQGSKTEVLGWEEEGKEKLRRFQPCLRLGFPEMQHLCIISVKYWSTSVKLGVAKPVVLHQGHWGWSEKFL